MGVKISNLPAIVTPAFTDIFPVVQAGVTYKETMTQLSGLFGLPVAIGAAGTVLRSDGTSWVASTSTFADTYAINTILYNASADTVSGLAATPRGVLVSNNTSVPSMLASATTTGQILQGSTTGTPTWSTPTYPSNIGAGGKIIRSDGSNNLYSTSTFADTYAVSTLLYAGSANTVSGLATTNKAALATSATGVPQWLALTDGQIVLGSTAGAPAAANLSAGVGIEITNASNSITINATGGGFAFAEVAGTTQLAVANTIYALNNAGATTVTLPSTASSTLGDTIKIKGASSAPWIIQASAGQTIKQGATSSTVAGTATSNAGTDSLQLVYVAANTWSVDFALSAGIILA